MTQWIEGRVVDNRFWAGHLFSLSVEAPGPGFVAGQFARLALPVDMGAGAEPVGRPYSFVNAPQTRPHEFYLVTVPDGVLSPRLAQLRHGDVVWLLAQAHGFFCVSEVPDGDVLWCLATGTGIAPFLSILRTSEPWERFRTVVLVQATRYASELVYRDVVEEVAATRGRAFRYVPVVSRESVDGSLTGRIPALIEAGALESSAGVPLSAPAAQVMVCGNPDMIRDVYATLGARGMRRHRRRASGHITSEDFW